MDKREALKEMDKTLTQTLMEVNNKIMAAGGKITMEDMKFIEPLTHSIKSVDTSIAMAEAGGSSHRAYDGGSNRSYENRSYDDRSYEGGSNYQGGAYRDSYESHRYVSPEYGESERRRDSMGRFTRDYDMR